MVYYYGSPTLKSLRYILGGRPHTLDDCLDLSRTQRPDKAILDVATDRFVTELCIVRQFVGTCRRVFPDREICCAQVYGCVSPPAREQEQKSCLVAANAKLQHRLKDVRRRGIEAPGSDRMFKVSECLCGRT